MKIIFFILFNFNLATLYCDDFRDFVTLIQDDWKFEEHVVQTEDGYLLRIFRVFKNQGGKPVLLIHGLIDSADDFFVNQKGSIGQVLVERGYDVWLLNVRGNKYSCHHRTLNNTSFEFWNFSFHEMGKYDLPAFVNSVYDATQQKPILIGHSQGTTLTFAGLSLRPQLQEKIEKFIALAPAVYFDNAEKTKSYFYVLASRGYVKILNKLGIYKMFEEKFNRNFLENLAIKLFCSSYFNVCDYFLKHFTDLDPEMIDNDQIPRFLQHVPSRLSTKCVDHYIQFIMKVNNDFQQYDYGQYGNWKHYGQDLPPTYDLQKITLPMYFYHGNDDELATMDGVKRLMSVLPKAKERFFDKFGHLTYFWGKDLTNLFVNLILDLQEEVKVVKNHIVQFNI